MSINTNLKGFFAVELNLTKSYIHENSNSELLTEQDI